MLNTLQKTAAVAAALAATGVMMVPASASAQSYYGDRYDRGYYDQCNRDSNTAGGAVVGGALGAVAGSQLAARGRRTEGSILGGVLGAVVGGSVARDSSRYCDDRYRSDYNYDRYDDRYRDSAYYGRDYDNRYYDDRYDRGGSYYGGQPYYSGGYGYQGGGYYDRGYSDRYYSSDRSGYSYSCRTVQSTTRDRYGRTVTYYREVC